MMESKRNDMEIYYAKRANEYENIYLIPERQKFIKESKNLLKKYLIKKNVLEIACGTGFWTEAISKVSTKILATDINNEVLEIAKSKEYFCEIDFLQDDTYKLDKIFDEYDSLFAGFWLSHVSKSRIDQFLEVIHSKLSKNALVIFMDNIYVEGNSTPISRFDTEGNSYQIRKLNDTSQHEVLKNYFDSNSLKKSFSNYGKDIEIHELKYYWILKYHKK